MTPPEDEEKRPYDAALVEMLHGVVRAKARVLVFFLALAVLTFVWFAKSAGHPVWLVALIGILGAVLIGFAIALVWFWLRFLSHFRGRN